MVLGTAAELGDVAASDAAFAILRGLYWLAERTPLLIVVDDPSAPTGRRCAGWCSWSSSRSVCRPPPAATSGHRMPAKTGTNCGLSPRCPPVNTIDEHMGEAEVGGQCDQPARPSQVRQCPG
ncbi:hypothetical protein [Amycolatopsis balhimycina]|uniref:hypothetical protein n=1 Tax=Amycolatopsis balhimycina TaxID=208443 RepID=UPI00037BBFCD|nr:hypothetical protein [Amycolatopsis balhimycina]